MNQEYDEEYVEVRSRLDRSELNATRQLFSAASDIGNQTGLAFRAPSFGESGLTCPIRDYSPLQYSTSDFNQRFLDTHTDAITNAAERYAVAISYGIGVTGQIGIFYPIIGFGPYFSFSLTAGLTSTGERFVQWQWSLGGGIGFFYGYGATEPLTFHGNKLQEGESHDNRIEVNGGLGPSGSLSVNREFETTVTASSTLGSKLSWGAGEGFAVAYVHSTTHTWINPDVQAKESWNDFATSVGREIHEIELQLYQWSRMMEP